jgi:DNA invertase Pin-like site-specific DNA recombinase
MPIDRGYIRQTRNGPPVAQQMDALRAAGVTVDGAYPPVYCDRLTDQRRHRAAGGEALAERVRAVADVRPGARLVVASLDRLGVSAGDIRAVLDALIDRGCAVHDVAAGINYDANTPRAILSATTLEAERTLKAERIKKAANVRAERIAAGVKAAVGGNKGWHPTAEEEAAAHALWNDFSLTQTQVAEAVGVAPITLRRRFGARGAPRGRRKTQSA